MFAEAFFDEMQKIAGPYGAVMQQPKPLPPKLAGIPRYLQTRPWNAQTMEAPDHHRVFAETRQEAHRLGRTRLPDADYATYMGRSFRNKARKNVVASPPRE